MAVRRNARWSRVLLVVGSVTLLLAGVAGYLNAAVVDGDSFASHLNAVRSDDEVQQQVGAAIATAAIDAQPDLVAVEPALQAGFAAIVGSPLLDGLFTRSAESFHAALTQKGADSAVLALADLGATVTTAVEKFLPDAAQYLPDDLNVTLAQIGGQSGVAARIIPVFTIVSTLAWVLPLVALVLLVLGVWVAPRRRYTLVRLGWLVVIVGGCLGVLTIAMAITAAVADSSTLPGAVLSASLSEFGQPLAVRAIATVVVGGLMVAAAGALLPQIDLPHYVTTARTFLSRRPATTGWAITRALAVVGFGLLVVVFPSFGAQVAVVLAGLAVVLYGITELDVLAERARAEDQAQRAAALAASGSPTGAQRGRSRAAWLIPAAAGVAGVVVLGALIIPDHLPQDSGMQTVSDVNACNGHVELCDRTFDQVVIPASHNSMSVADGEWFLAEQPKDMVDSLDDGIRGLLVDTWYAQATESGRAITAERSMAAAEAELVATYGSEVVGSIRRTIDRVRREDAAGPVEPYLCHTVCEIGASQMLGIMKRLEGWMVAHPRDVVVLFIQDVVTPKDTARVLRSAGLDKLAYTHPDGAAWPTLRQMIDADQRLIVLMENHGGGAETPWLHQGFELVQDTEYTFDSVDDFTCTLKRGSADASLFSVNHWLASFAKLVSNAELVNAYDVLKPRIDECLEVRGRAPSMIAVNWYDRGDLFRVVDELNGVA
ncbi:MAG: hypothetical protein WCF04_02045 [Candidatus Nanopelagicales bacterium]